MMQVLLPLNLLLLGFLASCDGACFGYQLKNINGVEMCEHLGVKHSIGNTWISEDCMKCSCGSGGLHCCQTYSTPTNFPSDCVAVFDKKNCKYVVHKKDDPKILCPIFGGVG